jgi:hypothetical protein
MSKGFKVKEDHNLIDEEEEEEEDGNKKNLSNIETENISVSNEYFQKINIKIQ